jgi:hypothetical protein
MTDISKKLEQVINSAQRKLIEQNRILPIKTSAGILVGDVLIVSKEHLKDLYKKDKLVYTEISLNAVAIYLANILAKSKYSVHADKVYQADQDYGRLFADSQILRNQYQRALIVKDHERADMLWARYCESRDRTLTAKKYAERLVTI